MLLAGTAHARLAHRRLPSCRNQTAAAVAAAISAPAGTRYWRSVARIGIQVADALEYAHQQGTLHRDIKPANLLLDNRGTVWIADFGLAKLEDLDDLTHSGDMVGTLRYMAPEQFEGKADARSDVYNLGLTLYELLTLRPAFDEKDRRRLIRQMTQEEPPRPRKLNPAIPRDLETIVVKAMAGDPGHRYQTAGELAADLRCFLEDRPIRARRASLAGRLWRWCRRNRAVAALAGTALALLVAVAVVASVGYLRTNQALRPGRGGAEAGGNQPPPGHQGLRGHLRQSGRRPATRPPEDDQQAEQQDDTQDDLLEGDEEDQQQWAAALWQNIVTGKDAVLLESMLKFYDQFAQQNQANVKLQKETARAHRRVGDIQRRLGQYDKAETAYRHALTSYQALAKGSPAASDLLTTIAAIDNELGVVCRDTGRFAEAGDAHRQALETLHTEPPEVAALPESRFELAKTYGYLSTPLLGREPQRGDPGGGRHGPRRGGDRNNEATENNRKAVEILEKLIAENPENSSYRLAMAHCQRDRYFLSARNHRDEADQARKEASRILEALVASAPHNPDYLYELAETYIMPSRPARGVASPADDKKQLQRAVEIGKDLIARYPTSPEYRALLARCYVRVAAVSRSAAALAKAEDEASKASSAAALAEAEDDLSKAVDLEKKLAVEFASRGQLSLFPGVVLAPTGRRPDRSSPLAASAGEPRRRNCRLEEDSGIVASNAGMLTACSARHTPCWPRRYGEMGESSLADAAAAKAEEAGFHRGAAAHSHFHRDRQRPPPPK